MGDVVGVLVFGSSTKPSMLPCWTSATPYIPSRTAVWVFSFRISVFSLGVKEIKVCFTETQTSVSGSGILNWLQGIVDALVEIRRLLLMMSTFVRRRPVAVSKFNTSTVAALQASSICSRVSRAF